MAWYHSHCRCCQVEKSYQSHFPSIYPCPWVHELTQRTMTCNEIRQRWVLYFVLCHMVLHNILNYCRLYTYISIYVIFISHILSKHFIFVSPVTIILSIGHMRIHFRCSSELLYWYCYNRNHIVLVPYVLIPRYYLKKFDHFQTHSERHIVTVCCTKRCVCKGNYRTSSPSCQKTWQVQSGSNICSRRYITMTS